MATRQLTKSGYEKLQLEIERIEKTELPEVIQQITDIQSDNYDHLEENSALSAVLQRRDLLQERLSELRHIIATAEIIDHDPDPNRANIGDYIKLRDLDYDEEFTILLIEHLDIADDSIRTISTDSAVGTAILGKEIGDIVTVEVPDGEIRYQIIAFENREE